MKRPSFMLGAALLCLALLLAWLFWPSEQSTPKAAQPPATVRSVVAPPPQPAVSTLPPSEERRQTEEERANTIRSAIEGTNVPIKFWGRVVDQNGAPLEGVKVSYSRQTEHSTLPGMPWANSKIHRGETATSAGGNFSITGVSGHYLTIEGFAKAGYRTPEQFAPARANYDYFGSGPSGRFNADKSRPVEFVMLAERAVEPLVAHGGNFGRQVRVPADGTPVRWNLWTGKSDPDGELQVTFKREATGAGQTGSWEAKVEVIGGGIVEAPRDENVWQAPEEGYQSAADYPKAEQTRGDPSRAFYIKTADGKYGRLELELFANDRGPTARCLVKTQMNPQLGSRSLAR